MTQPSSHEEEDSAVLNNCTRRVAQSRDVVDVTASNKSNSNKSWSSKKRSKKERRDKQKQQQKKEKLEQDQQTEARKDNQKKKRKDSKKDLSSKISRKQKPLDCGFDADDESDASVVLCGTKTTKTTTKSQPQTQASHQSNDNDNDNNNNNRDDDETLETPYYQSFALEGASPLQRPLGPTKANQEPLRPGDVIQYWHPIFVAGDPQGHRVTQIMAIHPHRTDFVLDLDNGDLLPKDHRIQRVQEWVGNKLYAHDGIYRNMDDFRWIPGTLDPNKVTGMARQVQHIKAMLAEGRRTFQQKVKQIYQTNDRSSSSSDDSDDDDSDDLFSSRRKKKKAATCRNNNNNNNHQDASSMSSCKRNVNDNAGDRKLPRKALKASGKSANAEDLLSSSSSSDADDDNLRVTQKRQPIQVATPPSREQQLKEMMDSDYDSDDSSLLIDPFASPTKKDKDVNNANKHRDRTNADDNSTENKMDSSHHSSSSSSLNNVQLQSLTTPCASGVDARPKFSLGRCQQSKTNGVQRATKAVAAAKTSTVSTQQQQRKMPVVQERHGGDDSDSDSDVRPPNERQRQFKTHRARQTKSTTAKSSASTSAVKTATSPIDLQDDSEHQVEKVQTAREHRGGNNDGLSAQSKQQQQQQQQQAETAKAIPKDDKLHPSSIDLVDSGSDDESAPMEQQQTHQEKQAVNTDKAVVTTHQEKQLNADKPIDQGSRTFQPLHPSNSENDSDSSSMKDQQNQKGCLDKPAPKHQKYRPLNLSSIDLMHSSDSESSLSDGNEDDDLTPRRTMFGKKPFPALPTPTASGRKKQGLSLSQKSDVFEFHSQEEDPAITFVATGPNSSIKKASPRITPIRVRDVAKDKKKRSSSTKMKKSASQLIYEGTTSGSAKSPVEKSSPTNAAPSSAARRSPRIQADATTGDKHDNHNPGKTVDSSTVSESSSEFEGESTTAKQPAAKQTKRVSGSKKTKQGTEEVDDDNEIDMVSSVGTANSSGSDTSDTEKERRNSTSELRLVTLTSPARKKKQDERAAYTSPLQEAFAAVEQIEAEANSKKRQAFSDPFKSSDEESEASDEKRPAPRHMPGKKKQSQSSPKVCSSARKKESTSGARKAKESNKNATTSMTVAAKQKKTTPLPNEVKPGSLKEPSNPRQQSTREKAVKKTPQPAKKPAKASSAKSSAGSAGRSGEPTHQKKTSTTQSTKRQSLKSNDSESDDTDWGTYARPSPKAPIQAPMSSTSNRSSEIVGLTSDSISSGTPTSPAKSDSSDDSVVVMPKPTARGAQPNISSLLTIATKQKGCYSSPQIEDDSDDSSDNDDAMLVGRRSPPKSGGRLDRPLTDTNGSRSNGKPKKKSSSTKSKMEKARLSGSGRLSFTKVSRSY